MRKKTRSTPDILPRPEKTFLFTCEICQIYPTNESTARKFITERLRSHLDRELAAGAAGAHLTFKGGGCPRCCPEGTFLVEVASLWPRRLH